MSQGDTVVINPLERALSEDINNLQSVERSRRLLESAARARSVPQAWSRPGQAAAQGTLYLDIPGTAVSGVRNGVLGGLTPCLPLAVGSTSLTIQPGALAYFDQAAGPVANYDPNAYKVGRLAAPLIGVTPGATYGGTPIPPAGLFGWLLVARAVDTTTVTTPREVYDPGTGQFVTQNVPKLQEGQIEFMFIDADVSPYPYPGDEWQLIAYVVSDTGVLTADLMDLRQMLDDGPGDSNSQPDPASVEYSIGAQQAHDMGWVLNGRRMYFGLGNISAGTFLDPNDGPILQDQDYTMWAFECRRPDGSYWRPPAVSLAPVGNANIVFSALAADNIHNTSAITLPSAAYGVWENWILGWGADEVQPYSAWQIGNFSTRLLNAEGQRVIRNGRRLINCEQDRYQSAPNVGLTDSNRFGQNVTLNINGTGWVDDELVVFSTGSQMTYGDAAKAIKYRMTFNVVASAGFDDDSVRPVFYLKTTNGDPSETNVLQAIPLQSLLGPNPPTTDTPDTLVAEFWVPASELTSFWIDIREGSGTGRVFDSAYDSSGFINCFFEIVEWEM